MTNELLLRAPLSGMVYPLDVPLTPETHHLIRAETIKLMKPGTILINVSRGALIDTKALIEALKCGHLGGVGLDVYEEEEGVFFEDLSGQCLQDDVRGKPFLPGTELK